MLTFVRVEFFSVRFLPLFCEMSLASEDADPAELFQIIDKLGEGSYGEVCGDCCFPVDAMSGSFSAGCCAASAAQ